MPSGDAGCQEAEEEAQCPGAPPRLPGPGHLLRVSGSRRLTGENGRAAEKGQGRQRHMPRQRAKGNQSRDCPALGKKQLLCTGGF